MTTTSNYTTDSTSGKRIKYYCTPNHFLGKLHSQRLRRPRSAWCLNASLPGKWLNNCCHSHQPLARHNKRDLSTCVSLPINPNLAICPAQLARKSCNVLPMDMPFCDMAVAASRRDRTCQSTHGSRRPGPIGRRLSLIILRTMYFCVVCNLLTKRLVCRVVCKPHNMDFSTVLRQNCNLVFREALGFSRICCHFE